MTSVTKALVGAAAAAIVAAAAPAAFAHAAYKSSNPANKSTVASPPGQVTAEFTEPLTNSSSMSVFDPCGNQVDNGDSSPSGYEMSVSMSADKAGTYTVEFRAQSLADSHVTSGSFTFTSSGGSPCPGSEPAPEPKAGGGGGGGSSGGGSGGGTTTTQDPATAAGSGDAGAVQDPGTSGGGAAARRPGGTKSGRGSRGSGRAGGGGTSAAGGTPVAFQPTGGTALAPEPAPWDLPLGGVAMAFALCVMIGAAGGRVYAGIVAPTRR